MSDKSISAVTHICLIAKLYLNKKTELALPIGTTIPGEDNMGV
jgi:hypothetical protein